MIPILASWWARNTMDQGFHGYKQTLKYNTSRLSRVQINSVISKSRSSWVESIHVIQKITKCKFCVAIYKTKYRFRDFGFIAPKTLTYLAFQYFDFEQRTWWRLFQKGVVRTKCDVYVLFKSTAIYFAQNERIMKCVLKLSIKNE